MYRSREVYKKIRYEVIKGALNPGERLIENDLVKKFNLSRGPIREAFRYLEKDGFIKITPNKGAIVAKVDVQEVKDFYAVLALVECKAVEWAYPNFKEADLQELNNINTSLKYWAHQGSKVDVVKWHEINFVFHNIMWSKSGNAKLYQLIKDIRKRLFRLRYWSIIADTYDEYIMDHEEIISYLRKEDPASAQKTMEKHIMKVCENHVAAIPNI